MVLPTPLLSRSRSNKLLGTAREVRSMVWLANTKKSVEVGRDAWAGQFSIHQTHDFYDDDDGGLFLGT